MIQKFRFSFGFAFEDTMTRLCVVKPGLTPEKTFSKLLKLITLDFLVYDPELRLLLPIHLCKKELELMRHY